MRTKLNNVLPILIIGVIGVQTVFAWCEASLFAGGDGTEESPYQISTAQQLQDVNECSGSEYNFVLKQNIDLTSYLQGDGWLPINTGYEFNGKFNGNGYKVSGLWSDRPTSDYVGLFGHTGSNAKISNVSVEIDNTKGGVKGKNNVGGLVGENSGGSISNSCATGSIKGAYDVGGLVGENYGSISNSCGTGSVEGSGENVGGLIGYNRGGSISNSFATGSVKGSNYIGGLVGTNSTTISNSYATGSVTNVTDAGGLIGYNSGTISSSFYNNQTSGQTDAGKGVGKTTSEMKTKTTYNGWDFEGVWEITDGYPTFAWQNPAHLASAIIAAIPAQTWTGSPITPTPSVSLNGNPLTAGTNFDYSYENNVSIGTATVKIVGKGSYLGQFKTVEFKIVAPVCGTGFAGGTGTEMDPYQITDAKSLEAIGNYCLGSAHSGKYYELQTNIDLTSYLASTSDGWQPIGNETSSFSGKFNGKGHKVSGLWVNRPNEYNVGLFGYSNYAKISNITVEINDTKNGVIGKSSVGGLVGYISDYGSISNSCVIGNVSSNNGSAGGLVGDTRNSSISNSCATGNVSGTSNVGGLVGSLFANTISNSFATGSVSGTSYVGGLVGKNDGMVSNSYATGSVSGTSYVGGLIGSGGTVSNGFYDKETSGKTDEGKGTGKTTAEMKMKSTYEGWNFDDIWEIDPDKNDGYPTFIWQNPGHLANAAVIAAIPEQPWTGSRIIPSLSVSLNGSPLIAGTDFESSYENNVLIGTATVKIVGKGSYSGQAKTVEFEIVSAECGTGFAGGAGTQANPYKISEAKNLDAISNCAGDSYSDKYYELQNNIDLSDYIANTSDGNGWLPIGGELGFNGKFNGNGYKVLGLWVNRPNTNGAALFANVSAAELKNIGVEIDDDKGGIKGKDNVGGLAGYVSNSKISNSYATGKLSGSWNVGGLVGYACYNSKISNSYAIGSVSGSGNVGGLAGEIVNDDTEISNSYAAVSVSANSGQGGLVGSKESGSTVSKSFYDKEIANKTDEGKGTGKTTTEMKTQSTYEGWDFEGIWKIDPDKNDGYPILQLKLQNKISLENAIVSAIPSQLHTGSSIEPSFTVTLGETTLTKNTDYSVSYSDNVDVGTAKITITGIGNYSGSKEISFAITNNGTEPIFSNRENPQIGRIGVQTTSNAILLSNLPANAKVEVYSLQGKRIYSAYPGNPKILEIGVQTKGIYIIKTSNQTMRVVVK